MIKNPKIGQEVWFFEPWAEDIHSAKITALGETEVSARNPEKYPYADIHWDDGGDSSCLLKDLYASREELQNKLKKEERKKTKNISAIHLLQSNCYYYFNCSVTRHYNICNPCRLLRNFCLGRYKNYLWRRHQTNQLYCLWYTFAPCCNRFNCRHGAWHGGLRYAKCIA